MDYPPAVLEKAQRLEQLLLRVATGEWRTLNLKNATQTARQTHLPPLPQGFGWPA